MMMMISLLVGPLVGDYIDRRVERGGPPFWPMSRSMQNQKMPLAFMMTIAQQYTYTLHTLSHLTPVAFGIIRQVVVFFFPD